MPILKNNLGYPRVGAHRQLKKASEQYWSGTLSIESLFQTARQIQLDNWNLQAGAGIDLIPCNDFSMYDQVLDMSVLLGAVPKRFAALGSKGKLNHELDLYFAMARGFQRDGLDIPAMEMTKWFDTNYHYIVPEFTRDQSFQEHSGGLLDTFRRARQATGNAAKPVLIGPVSYLLLGKEKEEGFDKLELMERLLPVFIGILQKLHSCGATWVQLDEPFLAMDISSKVKETYRNIYQEISKHCPELKILVATYFESLAENTELAVHLPVDALHIDLVRAPDQLDAVLSQMPETLNLSLGVVDGRNIWKNHYEKSLSLIDKAVSKIGKDRVMIAPSCSLLHTPYDLDLETGMPAEFKNWMAFAKQKLHEVRELELIWDGDRSLLEKNSGAIQSRQTSSRIHVSEVQNRARTIRDEDAQRRSPFPQRQKKQHARFQLPLFPTTTIGSFPQTGEVRRLRADVKKGTISKEEYEAKIEQATLKAIKWQEELGIDVLVHGEFERNDMVEYFGELMDGFLFTVNGWVQSYGSRCVKPPVIYGDVSRPRDMTVRWSTFAQAHTAKPMKGMLTGPVTLLQWSFVRDDQPRSVTANQIALAIRDEVCALEKAGIGVIQIDEPAIREGLPLRRSKWDEYLTWAVKAFRIAACGVQDETQIHTHMCYSEFNDIIRHIAAMDADVITIETSRSQMELLEAFSDFKYPNEIGPGVYDIHSPRVPSVAEMANLLLKAAALLPVEHLWVNPDCGLKTRKWPETTESLKNMVAAAAEVRRIYGN